MQKKNFLFKKKVNCIVCNNSDQNFKILTKKTREGIGLWKKCNKCGLAINFKGVDQKLHNNFYKKDYFLLNSIKRGTYLKAIDHFNKRLPSMHNTYLNLKKFTNKKMDVLEIGSAAGELAYYLNKNVNSYTCFELNPEYVKFINKKLKIKAYSDDFLDVDLDQKFDLIVLINTLDHVVNPDKYLIKIKKLLKNDGLIYLELPNNNQMMNSQFIPAFNNNFSNFMYQIAHYYSFDKKTLRKYLNKHQFKLKNISYRHNYNFLNLINWYLTGNPQNDYFDATDFSKITLKNKNLEKKFNNILKKVDSDVRNFLNTNELSETMCALFAVK